MVNACWDTDRLDPAESYGLNSINMVSELFTNLSSLIMRVENFSLHISTHNQWSLMMKGECIDCAVMELSCAYTASSGSDDLQALVLEWSPQSDWQIYTATHNMLSRVIECKLSLDYFLFVTSETA